MWTLLRRSILRKQTTNDFIRKLLPSSILMRIGLTLPHGQDGIDHQHPLPRPSFEMTVLGHGFQTAIVVLVVVEEFLVYVSKGWWYSDPFLDGKAEAVALTRSMIFGSEWI